MSSAHADIYEIIALRLYLGVGMASADGRIDERERQHLAEFIEKSGVSDEHRSALRATLAQLFKTPPSLDALLRNIVDNFQGSDLAQVLIQDLIDMARIDEEIDPREEGFIRLICGALGVDPVSLYASHERAASDVSREELSSMVRGLLGMSPA